MKTAKQREEDFRRDLAELLARHGAELNVTDDGRPWGLHSGVCEVWMDGKYDGNGDTVAECAEFRL